MLVYLEVLISVIQTFLKNRLGKYEKVKLLSDFHNSYKVIFFSDCEKTLSLLNATRILYFLIKYRLLYIQLHSYVKAKRKENEYNNHE